MKPCENARDFTENEDKSMEQIIDMYLYYLLSDI